MKTRPVIAALGASIALMSYGLAAPNVSTTHAAVSAPQLHSGCYFPKTTARGQKDPHQLTMVETKAMEQKYRGDLQAKFGGTVTEATTEAIAVTGPVTIPVNVYVITDGTSATAVSDATISAQISALNASYAGTSAGSLAASNFSFSVVSTQRITNKSWAAKMTPGSRAEKQMKNQLHKGTAGTLNVYITGLGSSGRGRAHV